MKQKLSNYIAEKLLASGITDVFMITGGGAMHLDDALGHQEGLHCLYNHHEQACAMAAEAYARIHNKIAAVCVTTGPGGINAMNGVAGGFLDSIPMFVISGQVRYDTTARSTGLHLRAMGDQEYDITKSVANMTKYCEMVIDPMRIRFCVEKSLSCFKFKFGCAEPLIFFCIYLFIKSDCNKYITYLGLLPFASLIIARA